MGVNLVESKMDIAELDKIQLIVRKFTAYCRVGAEWRFGVEVG